MESAGFRMAEALHAAIGTPAKFSPLTIDGTAKPLVSDLVGGFMGLSGRTDLDNADFLMLVGVNPVVSHGHAISMPNPTGTVRDIARRGQVWVIDPRRTETARLATGHLAPRPSTDHAVLAYLVREVLRDGMKTDVPVQGVDALAAAVEPFTLEHTAAFADVPEAELTRLCAAVRGAECVAIETGIGVTMTAERGNVTQWLAWVLMILTGAMNRPGGTWFHPGFAYQLETFGEFLPVTPIEGSFGPGPRSRPEAQAFINEWPCAVLPDEIEAGHIRALINVGGSLVTSFPETGKLIPALQQLEVFATTEIINNETTELATHVLPTKDPLERPDITIHDILSSRVSVQHTACGGGSGRRAAIDVVGVRRNRPTARLRPQLAGKSGQQHRRRRTRRSARGRAHSIRRGGGHGLGRGRSRATRRMGRRPHRPDGRLAPGAAAARRSAGRARAAAAAGDGAAQAAEEAERAARLSR